MKSPPASYPGPGALLEKYGLRAKKSWGQNFLFDEVILDDIARLAVRSPGEHLVELGAGLGHLTVRLLARGARVVAVERDRDMARVLRGELGGRVELLEADAVGLDYGALAASTTTTTTTTNSTATATATATANPTATTNPPATASQTPQIAVVGNLPYHLSSPILFSILDQARHVSRAVLLLQREVAERLAASPGSKAWGLLSVLLQHRAEVRVARRVPRGAFLPPPAVESAVLVAELGPPRAPVADEARFRRLVKAGFAQRRKTLANALAASRLAPPERLAEALALAGIDPRRRGETLTVGEWAALERALG